MQKIAKKEGIKQRQKYRKESKNLLREAHNGKNPKRHSKAVTATKKLRTLAGRQVRELEKNMNEEQKKKYENIFKIFNKIIIQTRYTKDKIYSPHKPQTACIAKGKASHMYEFGQKVGMIMTAKYQIIIAIKAFEGNPHDSKTIEPLLQQMVSEHQELPKTLVYDRRGRGAKEVMGVEVITPGKPKKSDTAYEKKKKRYPFQRRPGLNPYLGT